VLVAWGSLLAGVALVGLALAVGERSVTLDGRTVGSVLYLGITAAAGFLSMFWLLTQIGAVYVSLHALVVPLLALVWGAAFYGEALTLSLCVGAVVVAAGIVLVTGEGVLRARIDRRARARVT
jgi:drug/metabolite transporter (DMT)-like permease